jgi:hypothetical protein
MRRALLAGLLACASPLLAAATLDVAAGDAAVFIHLEASGRASLAVSADRVGLAWEDNRSGAPRCHLGVKHRAEPAFRVFPFGRGECFEPGLSPLPDGRFLLIWEDEAGVGVGIVDTDGIHASALLAPAGGQGAVAHHPSLGAMAVWTAPEGRWRRLWSAPLRIDGLALSPGPAQPVDASPPRDDQSFPALAATAEGLALVWEDRRLGHTVIFASRNLHGQAWAPPRRVSANPSGQAAPGLGRGTGAMRPALAAFGARLAAVWLDKRDFLSGYDVYAAFSDDGGASYGKDGKAQDSFGDAIAQWHAAVAGNRRGDLVVAFDDERDGSADVWLTRWTVSGWGGDFSPADASGAGRQGDPAIALDDTGHLHLAWVERDAAGATRLRYTVLPPP